MNTIIRGLIAGFVATLVLSLVMTIKNMSGVLLELNVIRMVSEMMNGPPIIGWLIHFMIGSILWGGGFAVVQKKLTGKTATFRGITFGVVAWALMMIGVMPTAGAGVLGLRIGVAAPILTLMLHAAYGAVLGWTFQELANEPTDIQMHTGGHL